MLTSTEDLSKYPFTKEASKYVKDLDLKIEELTGLEYVKVITRAEQRITDALIYGIVNPADLKEKEAEILSFPIAVFLVSSIGDDFLKKRYSLAEAKRAYELLKDDTEDKLVEIAKITFNWKARIENSQIFLNVFDYLRNSVIFHEDSWKLVNKMLIKGEVFLRREEFARLLQEEILKHIETLLKINPQNENNISFTQNIERINQKLAQRKNETQREEFPKNAVSSAYPPCVKKIYSSLQTSQHISHMGRFTLTTFLLNVGMKPDDLAKLYTSFSDFNKEQTEYQVEHIAGEKGSRTKYIPPLCSTLKTHSLCSNPDELCRGVRHPLTYYRKKLKLINVLVDKNE